MHVAGTQPHLSTAHCLRAQLLLFPGGPLPERLRLLGRDCPPLLCGAAKGRARHARDGHRNGRGVPAQDRSHRQTGEIHVPLWRLGDSSRSGERSHRSFSSDSRLEEIRGCTSTGVRKSLHSTAGVVLRYQCSVLQIKATRLQQQLSSLIVQQGEDDIGSTHS